MQEENTAVGQLVPVPPLLKVWICEAETSDFKSCSRSASMGYCKMIEFIDNALLMGVLIILQATNKGNWLTSIHWVYTCYTRPYDRTYIVSVIRTSFEIAYLPCSCFRATALYLRKPFYCSNFCS